VTDLPVVSVSAEAEAAGKGEGERTYHVEVRPRDGSTSHTVEVPVGLAAELGWADGSEEELVRRSFLFLLAREEASSILRRFRLDVISTYFPEYSREIRP
jgi:hypothetical protein